MNRGNIVKVYTYNGRQVLFDILWSDGSLYSQATRDDVLKLLHFDSYIVQNASLTRDGKVRVPNNVVREQIKSYRKTPNRMIYLAKATRLCDGSEVNRIILKDKLNSCDIGNIQSGYYYADDFKLSSYNLVILDDLGNEVKNYNIRDLYGTQLDASENAVILYVFRKEYWSLYKEIEVLGRKAGFAGNFIHFTPYKNIYYFFKSSVGFTLGDLLTKATLADYFKERQEICPDCHYKISGKFGKQYCWHIDMSTLIVRTEDGDIWFKIKNIDKFMRLLTKFHTLKRNN